MARFRLQREAALDLQFEGELLAEASTHDGVDHAGRRSACTEPSAGRTSSSGSERVVFRASGPSAPSLRIRTPIRSASRSNGVATTARSTSRSSRWSSSMKPQTTTKRSPLTPLRGSNSGWLGRAHLSASHLVPVRSIPLVRCSAPFRVFAGRTSRSLGALVLPASSDPSLLPMANTIPVIVRLLTVQA